MGTLKNIKDGWMNFVRANENYDNLLNSKSEWGQNSIPIQKTVVADYVQGQSKPEASPQTACLDNSSQKSSQI